MNVMKENNMIQNDGYDNGQSTLSYLLERGEREALGGGRRFTRNYEINSFYDYEKRIMQEGCCPSILPMSFIQENGRVTVFYDVTGYRLLKDDIEMQLSAELEMRGPRQLLCNAVDILADIIEKLKYLENHLLFPERLHLDLDCIFIHTVSRKAVFSYIPKRMKESNFEKQLLNLLEDIKGSYHHPEIDQYYDRLINFMKENNPGLDGLISNLGMIQRELSYIYNHSEHFRVNTDSIETPAEEMKVDEALNEKSNFRIGIKFEKRSAAIKLVTLQLAFVLLVAAIYLSAGLDLIQLAGFICFSAGVDLWLVRKLNLKGQSSAAI